MVIAANEDAQNKLREEREKHDNLMNERLELEEKLRLKKIQFEEDTEAVEV